MTILPLHLDKIIVRRDNKTILGPLSIKFTSGKLTMIVGANGAGKSLLLRTCHGLIKPSSGLIKWHCANGRETGGQAFVFQRNPFLQRSAIANVLYPLKVRKIAHRAKRQQIARAVLRQVGLSDMAERQVVSMSEGEKQKLALARSLALDPEVLFLDEPSANLDPASTRDLEIILQEVAAGGVTVIMSSHDIGQIRRLAERIIFLNRGQIVEDGDADILLNQAQTHQFKEYINGKLVL